MPRHTQNDVLQELRDIFFRRVGVETHKTHASMPSIRVRIDSEYRRINSFGSNNNVIDHDECDKLFEVKQISAKEALRRMDTLYGNNSSQHAPSER